MAISRGPFCQSCGRPMEKAKHFGTDSQGNHVNDYCSHCYAGGKFTMPEISLDHMADMVKDQFAKNMKIPGEQARDQARQFLSKLKRWSQQVSRAA